MPGRRRAEGGPCRQRKRRGLRIILTPALLVLLLEGESHGYELMEQLKDVGIDSDCFDSSILYRDLRDMEELGLITSRWDDEDSKGPRRRVYKIQEEGLAQLEELIGNLNNLQTQISGLVSRYQKALSEKEK